MEEQSKYVEVRYKLLREDFEVFAEVAERDCWRSPTALIKANSEKQVKILKGELKVNIQKGSN